MRVVVLLVLLGGIVGTSSAFSAEIVKLKNERTERCLNIHGGQHDYEGGPVTSYTCTKHKDQEWRLIRQNNGYVKLKNRRTGRCLNVHGRDDKQGGRVTSYSCANTHDQEWKLMRLSGSRVKLRNRRSGRCLNIHGGQHDYEGGPATVYSCATTPDQEWRLMNVGGASASPRCVDYVIESFGRSVAVRRSKREQRAKRRAIRRWTRTVEGRSFRQGGTPVAGTAYSDIDNAEIESFNCSGRPLKCVLRARPCRD